MLFQIGMPHVIQLVFANNTCQKLYCNRFSCLVVGFIVVGFSCCRGGHCNHVHQLKLIFLGVFKVHRGLRLGFQARWIVWWILVRSHVVISKIMLMWGSRWIMMNNLLQQHSHTTNEPQIKIVDEKLIAKHKAIWNV